MDSQANLKATEQNGIELLYRGARIQDHDFEFQLISEFNNRCEYLDIPALPESLIYNQEFLIPEHYRVLDVVEYLADLVPADPGRQSRVAEELAMFQARNLFPILRMLIYIVDQMRNNQIVWGVGRGSSVASYCLYLIGVHRIDSYAYDLSIHEFLK